MKALLNALRPRAIDRNGVGSDEVSQVVAVLRRQLEELHEELSRLKAQTDGAQRHVEQLLELERAYVNERAALAGIPRARLLSNSMELNGTPTERLRVKRLNVGKPVERSFRGSVGLIRCDTETADVRELWEWLLALERECGDEPLRGLPSTILDVPDASVSVVDGGSLRISLGQASRPTAPVLAVPRFAYDCPPRKLANFSHWLLDCVPQLVALANVAPESSFLLPGPCSEVQYASLSLLGIARHQLIAWDGSPVECSRLLAFESDGRTGGGRALSPLTDVRDRLAARVEQATARRDRRLFVSRHDAKASRRWLTNEAEVEALFESRGFEILCVTDHSLDELAHTFREARVVAGLNGAGLAHLLFASPGTHVIVLFTDGLIRWYAGESGARSLWTGGHHATGGRLSALGDSPRFYAHVAAALEQVCHAFVGTDLMPLDRLAGFVDDALAAVDR